MLMPDYPDEDYEIATKHHTCEEHKRNPGSTWAGCTCGASYEKRRKNNTVSVKDEFKKKFYTAT